MSSRRAASLSLQGLVLTNIKIISLSNTRSWREAACPCTMSRGVKSASDEETLDRCVSVFDSLEPMENKVWFPAVQDDELLP